MPKCRFCGKIIDKENAFKAPTNGGGFYYCNEKEFKTKEEEKSRKIKEELEAKKARAEERKRKAEEKQKALEEKEKKPRKLNPIYEEFADILESRDIGGIFFREEKIWKDICSDEKILFYLQENKEYLKNAIKKINGNNSRIAYLSAILKNNLRDYEIKSAYSQEPIKVNNDFEMYEPKVSTRKKRIALSDLEDEV